MEQYIKKSALVAEIDRRINKVNLDTIEDWRYRIQMEHDIEVMKGILSFIDTLEVKDHYEQCIQYPSVKDGIKDHAETYSFNIESELFPQLTKEQQKLWRKEIEQACISGGDAGATLARDPRYKENLKVKEVDLEKELESWRHNHFHGRRDIFANGEYLERVSQLDIAKHFFELGLKAQKIQDEIKIGETEIYLEDDGGEPPYDGIQWLDLSCMEYEIPKHKFKDGDNVEIIIRKTQKRELYDKV